MIDIKNIARTISHIENQTADYENILLGIKNNPHFKGIIGLTGAPGAGKSTLADGLINQMVLDNKKVAVLCIDPSSPFNMGALLGDRIRMNKWYNEPNVFIRSFGSRKMLGGLCPMIIEITEYIKSTAFDFIIIETVGVGQNEIDVASLADVTVLIMVPEGGDDVQTMKSGIIEIADILVVNKSDRPGADVLVKNLQAMISHGFQKDAKAANILKTAAHEQTGVEELYKAILLEIKDSAAPTKKHQMLAEKAYQMISAKRMKDVDKAALKALIEKQYNEVDFNLFTFINNYSNSKFL